MKKYSMDFSQEDLSRLAQDPAVQQLLRSLQNADPQLLQSAVQQASSGDLHAAKKTISSLLENGQLPSNLEQLGR